MNLLGFEFRKLASTLAIQMLDGKKYQVDPQQNQLEQQESNVVSLMKDEVKDKISLFDLKRLESYSKSLVDFHLIMDLMPTISKMHFKKSNQADRITLSAGQSAILLGFGLQFK
jgi:N-acetyltransferase 10